MRPPHLALHSASHHHPHGTGKHAHAPPPHTRSLLQATKRTGAAPGSPNVLFGALVGDETDGGSMQMMPASVAATLARKGLNPQQV